jgi:FKBP-type peptidyl-prolyl cis-trans isomerase
MRYFFALCLVVVGLSSCTKTDVALSATEQANTDDRLLREYLASKNITLYTRTPSGNYVVIDTASGTERLIRNGDFAYLRYRLYLPNKESVAIDSNTVDSVSGLFRVEVGVSGKVINGFQEGLKLLHKGDKARLFVPSSQGYGTYGSGSSIPANQNLIFDIKVVNVL